VDPLNDVFVSAASVWEIAIKRSLGRLEAPDNLGEEVRKAGFIELPVTIRHGELAARLPPHHGDPFDRMLVAQAQAEGLVLVTRDRVLGQYAVPTLTA
jgi:PIN domain nuclease of toxin-antitoxin system